MIFVGPFQLELFCSALFCSLTLSQDVMVCIVATLLCFHCSIPCIRHWYQQIRQPSLAFEVPTEERDRGGLLHCKEFDIMQLIPQQQPSVMGFIITVWPETMSITWLYGSLHSWHEQCTPHISFPVIWRVCHMLVTIKTSLYDQRPWIDPG